ncbi:MAG: N-acetyltransferase family protein [Pseudomonadota bacterium]
MRVDRANAGDAGAIANIYRPYVEESWISFEGDAPDDNEIARRIESAGDKYPWLVVRNAKGEAAGYAYAGPHRSRYAYRTSVDVAIYMSHAVQGKGLGKRLFGTLLDILTGQNFIMAYGGIAQPNPASMALHSAMGFEEIARYSNVGFKQGAWRDTVWMQRPLAPSRIPPADLLPVPGTIDLRW